MRKLVSKNKLLTRRNALMLGALAPAIILPRKAVAVNELPSLSRPTTRYSTSLIARNRLSMPSPLIRYWAPPAFQSVPTSLASPITPSLPM